MQKIILKLLLLVFVLLIPEKSNQIVFGKNHFKLDIYKPKEKKINGFFKSGENLYTLFNSLKLSKENFIEFKEKIEKVFDLKSFKNGNRYEICLNDNNEIKYFNYWIDDHFILKLEKKGDLITAFKEKIEYEIKYLIIKGTIENSLISSFEEKNINVALELSEIFSSDIDFWTDLRKGDWFKILIEGLFLEGKFKLYGKIIFAEFYNNGKHFKAYYFKDEDAYFDENGKSRVRQFLRTPMNFKRISSKFSLKRYHPILKIYRPHHGIDFVAPLGTPVCAIGDGVITFAGFKGNYGNLIIIKHKNNFESYYGHLSKFSKNIKKEILVKQGDLIGYVGSTGLATGAHLHYELRKAGIPINPFKLKIPSSKEIPKEKKDKYLSFVNYLNAKINDLKFEKKQIVEDFKWALY